MIKGVILTATTLLFLGLTTCLGQDKQSQGLEVSEAKLGKNVQDKQIVDTTTTFGLTDRAYLWLKLVGGNSDSITVTWNDGTESYPTTLNVGGSPWRTWSYKTLSTTGDWKVTVTDANGNVLKEMKFQVVLGHTKQSAAPDTAK